MNKFTLLLFALMGLSFALSPVSVLAHQSHSEGSISALLHVNPSDRPIVGSPASLMLIFTDTENKFNSTQCDCTAEILEAETVLHADNLFKDGNTSLASSPVSYTFTKEGTYTVRVTGIPKGAAEFHAFTLTFPVTVQQQTIAPSTQAAEHEHTHSGGNYTLYNSILLATMLATGVGSHIHTKIKHRQARQHKK